MWFKSLPPPPPVPSGVREMLKDYPEIIQDLQDGLNGLVSKMVGKSNATHPFERAIWLLKDSLGARLTDALEEERAAKANGDHQTFERAQKKGTQIAHARSHGIYGGGLKEYFEQYMSAFE